MNKKKVVIAVIAVLILVICVVFGAFLMSLEEPDVNVVDISLSEFNTVGRSFTVKVTIQIDNPNPISATFESIDLEVFVGEKQVGYSDADVDTEISSNSVTLVVFPLVINDYPVTYEREVEVRATGMATVSVFTFSYDVPVEEKTTLTLPIPAIVPPSK